MLIYHDPRYLAIKCSIIHGLQRVFGSQAYADSFALIPQTATNHATAWFVTLTGLLQAELRRAYVKEAKWYH